MSLEEALGWGGVGEAAEEQLWDLRTQMFESR